MKETPPQNNIETRKITDEEALYFVEHLKEEQEIFDGQKRFVFKGYDSKKNVIVTEPDHANKDGSFPKHHFLKEVLVKIVKNNPINIQDFGATLKKSDPELEEFRKAQRKAALLEKIEKEGLPFIETLSVSEIKDKDVAKKIAEVKKFAKIGEGSPYGKLSIKEIKERALKNKRGKVKAPQQIEAKESWTEKILKKVEEKRKKVLETFVKKSGYYGKLVLKGATALVASVGILHGELGRNTEIYTSANTKVEEPAPKQETSEEILAKLNEQFAKKQEQAEKAEEEYTEKEKLAQNAFRKGERSAKEAFETPVTEQVTQKEEESSVEAPVPEIVSSLEVNPTEGPRVEISDMVLKDFMNSINKNNEITPEPEPVYEVESTPTPVIEKTEERIPEPEQVKILAEEEIQPTTVEPAPETQEEKTEIIPKPTHTPLAIENIKNKTDLINFVCEGEENPEKRWNELKILNAKEIIEHKGLISVDPVFKRLRETLLLMQKEIGEPLIRFWGMGKNEIVENYTNRYLKYKK